MECLTQKQDGDQSTTSICERRHSPLTHREEKTIRSAPRMHFRRRRIRSFVVLTTTLWWCQTIVLLQLLPQSMASNGRIPPPPPPRPPPKVEQKLSDSTCVAEKPSPVPKTMETNTAKNTTPPPPPPLVVPVTAKDEDVEAEKITKVETPEIKRSTPPPPPARTVTKQNKIVTSATAADKEKSPTPSFSVSKEAEEEDSSTASEMKSETPLHQEEQASGLYQYVRQQQSQQQSAMQNNYYPQQHYHQQQYYHQQYYHQPQQPQQQQRMRQKAHQQSRRQGESSSSGSALTSTLKGLWGKVERGLDDLVSLEGSVAGQAQKLVNSAISTATTASRLSPSALRSLAQSSASAAVSGDRAATSSSSRTNRSRRAVPSVSDVPLKPYGQKYQIAREAKEKEDREKKNDRFQSTTNVSSNKRVHDIFLSSDKSRSIATKGGATSSPHDYPQSPQQPPSSASSLNGSASGEESGTADAWREASNPSLQNHQSNPNSDRRTPYGSNWDTPDRSREPENESQGSTPPSNDTFGGRNPSRPVENRGSGPAPNGNPNGHPNRDQWDSGGRAAGYPSRPQPRREPPQDQNAHSRSSRIPWNDSSPNQQPPSSSQPHKPAPSQRPDFRFDDDDVPSWKRVLKGFSLPPMPSLGKLKMPGLRKSKNNAYYSNLDVWDSEEDAKKGGLFGFFQKSSSSSVSTSSNILSRNQKQDTKDGQPALVASMIARCKNGKTVSLLSSNDAKASKLIGRFMAVLDVLFLVSSLLGFKLLSGFDGSFAIPSSWKDFVTTAMPMAGSIMHELVEGSWALFAFLYAALFKYYRDNVLEYKMGKLASTVSSSVKEESEYSQLYLRLLAATPMDRNLPDRMAAISKLEVASLVAKSRLNAFVGIVLASLTVMTVSALGPFVMAIVSAMTKIVLFEEWRKWPIAWEGVFSATSAVMQNLFHSLESQGASVLRSFLDHPIQFSFHLSMFGALLISTLLPGVEERRAVAAKKDEEDEEDAGVSNIDSAEEWSRLGTSSASRLSMLSENGSVENALARWRASRVSPLDERMSYGSSLSTILRLVGYGVLAALLAASPLLVSHFVAGETPPLSDALSIFRWDSLFDLSFLQLSLFGLVWRTLRKVVTSGNDASIVKEFQSTLVSTQEEVEESNKSNAAFHAMGSVSPSAGIAVRDLWSAHATKRAWAIRGANFQCKNGEILAILGEDGNGKTRLLTTVAESLVFPPKRTTTTNKVRGLIAIGGLDVAKWDRKMLKRRLGVFLSDVRMVADSASLFSGWTMEEILEPVDGIRSSNNDMHRSYTKAEKSAMTLALKVRKK